MGRLGERRARLRHGQARDLRHLDDAIGVRDRRSDEGQRGRCGDADRRREPSGGHGGACGRGGASEARARPSSSGSAKTAVGRSAASIVSTTADLDRRHRGTEQLTDLDGARPVRRIRREQGVDERRRLGRSVRHVGEQRRSGLVRPAQPDRQPVVALERGAPRQQPEEQAAERVHVGGGLAVGAPGLLGRPVLGRPEQHALGRDAGRRARDPREAEVGDDDAPGGALDQDVARREVAVHDPSRMRVGERGRDRQRDLGGLRPGERRGCVRRRRGSLPRRAPSRETGSRRPRRSRRGGRCSRARAERERAPRVRIDGEARDLGNPRVEELDRDVTAQAPVAGAPDRAHATFADASAKLVAAGDEVGHVREGGHGEVSRGRTRGKM